MKDLSKLFKEPKQKRSGLYYIQGQGFAWEWNPNNLQTKIFEWIVTILALAFVIVVTYYRG